jgi:hypothetical protein
VTPSSETRPIPANIAKELASGDGRSQATAYVIHEDNEAAGVDKEYQILAYLGLRPKSQSLIDEDKINDALTLIDPNTGSESNVWFDIGKFFGKL